MTRLIVSVAVATITMFGTCVAILLLHAFDVKGAYVSMLVAPAFMGIMLYISIPRLTKYAQKFFRDFKLHVMYLVPRVAGAVYKLATPHLTEEDITRFEDWIATYENSREKNPQDMLHTIEEVCRILTKKLGNMPSTDAMSQEDTKQLLQTDGAAARKLYCLLKDLMEWRRMMIIMEEKLPHLLIFSVLPLSRLVRELESKLKEILG